jgi:hypothetical protein
LFLENQMELSGYLLETWFGCVMAALEAGWEKEMWML